jgi:chromosome segregation ATPase
MGKVYRSLTGVVQETLHRSKANSMVSAREKASDVANLNDATEEFEKIIVDRIGRLRAAVRDSQAVVAGEFQNAEQVIQTLRTNIAVLEAKLGEMEDTVRRKDVASQRMQENLSTKIRDLQSAVEKREEALERQMSEVNDLKSKMDAQGKQVTQLEQAIQHAKAETASEAKRAAQITASSNAKSITLEAQLRETQEIVRGKDSTLKGLEQNHLAKIQDLESQLRTKEKDLADRNKEVNDLKSEVKLLTKGIKERSSLFRQAEALADIQAEDILADSQAQNTGTADAGKQLKTAEEKPAASQSTAPIAIYKAMAAQNIGAVDAGKQLKTGEVKLVTSRFQDVGVTSNVRSAAPETVSREAFDRIIREFGELTNVMGPIASLVVRDHVKALGESMGKFPKTRLTELIEALSGSDDKLKTSFCQRLGEL